MTNNKITANHIITALAPALGQPVMACPAWVKQAATIAHPPKPRYGQTEYSTTAASFFTEVTVRIPTNKKNRRGKPKPQNRRIDLLAAIQPHYKIYNPLIIGVEIKVAISDLMGDKKIKEYLNYCHLFYLAVPHWMQAEAEQKLKQDKVKGVGLLLVNEGGQVTVTQTPTLTTPTLTHLSEVYAELLIKPIKQERDKQKRAKQRG